MAGPDSDERLTRALHHQMRVRFGSVPDSLAAPSVTEGGLSLNRDEFLFSTPGGVRYHFRRGHGIVAALPGPWAQDEFEIFLWGTVFGAVAWLGGMFPLHAGAVAAGGRVMAFTAESGGGKSTLATALAARGFAHVCDDTLTLAADGAAVRAIPDGKPIKLWADALTLTDTPSEREIAMIPGKHFTRPLASTRAALPLTDVFVLESGPALEIERLRGPEVLVALTEAMYRPQIAVALGDKAAHGQWLMRLAREVRFWRLRRPWSHGDRTGFAQAADAIAEALRNLPAAGA